MPGQDILVVPLHPHGVLESILLDLSLLEVLGPLVMRKVYSVFSTVFLRLLLLAVAVGCPAACFGR